MLPVIDYIDDRFHESISSQILAKLSRCERNWLEILRINVIQILYFLVRKSFYFFSRQLEPMIIELMHLVQMLLVEQVLTNSN